MNIELQLQCPAISHLDGATIWSFSRHVEITRQIAGRENARREIDVVHFQSTLHSSVDVGAYTGSQRVIASSERGVRTARGYSD